MSRDILGHITCPHCQNDKATVHRQAKGSRALYYRCYDGEKGDCGTVQIILKGGQAWIKANMRPLAAGEVEIIAQEAAEVAKEQATKAATVAAKKLPENKAEQTNKKSSMFSKFFEDSHA